MRPLFTAVFLSLAAVAAEKPIVAIYDLEGAISESGRNAPSLLNLGMEPTRPLTLFDLTRSLAKAASDPQVKAVVVDADDAQLGLSQLQELHRRLTAVREAGKDVWVYSDSFNHSTALLGSTANHFTLMPEADVTFSGLHSESMYFKGLLDKVGVVANVIHIGDFKSYGEEFYRTGPSEFAQRQQEELVGGIFDQLLEPVAHGRGIAAEKVRELVDRGTFTAADAKEAGLVDDLKHRTDFAKAVREAYEGADFDRDYELPDLAGPRIEGVMDVFKLMFQGDKSKSAKNDYVAVVVLEGGISNESIAPVRTEILKLMKDERAKALVLRVDSPGGSALASEVLWEATDEWKSTGRPFVVSMGGVAASGGYYVSCGADRIFAEAGTITGSIGVVGMKLVLGGALEKLGISTHVTKRGRNAGAMSMMKPFSDEEAELVRESMLGVYGTFKKRVADGRGERLKGDLESLAGGRVYTGIRALEIGLVDEIGGLHEAIVHAAEKAGVDPASVRLSPEPRSPFEGLFAPPQKPSDDEIIRIGRTPSPLADAFRAAVLEVKTTTLPAPVLEAVGRAAQRLESCKDGAVQLIGPDISIRIR